ncbi:MAG: polysaccharide biosynthesis protein [Candidatus Protistobacter heckmanni]|nr:polysaccharide biosynthesis protein [Candidatus Protistobacter heckmanni]
MQTVLINLPRIWKQGIVALADIAMALVSTWAAFSLRLDEWHWPTGYQWFAYVLPPLLAVPVFTRIGLYLAVFRYTGLSALVDIGKTVFFYGLVYFLILMGFAFPGVPRSLGILQPLIFLILIASSRSFARFWLNSIQSAIRGEMSQEKRWLIYGAGAAGVQIASALAETRQFAMIGFLDDDASLHGKTINGRKVYSPKKLDELIEQYAITDVVLSLPSASRVRRNEILSALRNFQVHVRSLPGLMDIAQGKVTVTDIQELDEDDLLGRECVPPNPELMQLNITDKAVMVTGAGGSIGSELCRQILENRPARLILLDHNEFGLYEIQSQLQGRLPETSPETELVPLLGNVRDPGRIREVISIWQPDTIYHAAAYKHVPMVERNVAEGIKNNVFGTLNTAIAAGDGGVASFVLVSTDKAVRPTNVMGASKRLAELVIQALAVDSATKFSMVRFGNVLGSSGSVVPLFRQQIRQGGPITLTDPEVTRYFMTIPEAAQLVIQAGAMAEGGDVFVLDMSDPVKISDLAKRMVELSGLSVKSAANPDGDIEIQVTGLRPGEKLYEELLIGENPQTTAHARIMKAQEDYLSWHLLQQKLAALEKAAEENQLALIRAILKELVNGYKTSPEVEEQSKVLPIRIKATK